MTRERLASLLKRLSHHRPIWVGDDGSLRCGRTDDMIALMERLKAPTILVLEEDA